MTIRPPFFSLVCFFVCCGPKRLWGAFFAASLKVASCVGVAVNTAGRVKPGLIEKQCVGFGFCFVVAPCHRFCVGLMVWAQRIILCRCCCGSKGGIVLKR